VEVAGWLAGGAAAGGGLAATRVSGGGVTGAGVRRAISSGRTMTAMKAAASPTMADAVMKVRILRIGRVDMDRIFLVARRL
jgi:hypothetical protein